MAYKKLVTALHIADNVSSLHSTLRRIRNNEGSYGNKKIIFSRSIS